MHAFGTSAFCGDTSSVNNFQTALEERHVSVRAPRLSFNIVINDDHFEVLHGDPVLLLKSRTFVQVIDMFVKLV